MIIAPVLVTSQPGPLAAGPRSRFAPSECIQGGAQLGLHQVLLTPQDVVRALSARPKRGQRSVGSLSIQPSASA
jgi:hypothetical protein